MNSNIKKTIILILIIILSCSACGKGKTIIQTASSTEVTTVTSQGTASSFETSGNIFVNNEDGFLIARSESPFDFCTKYSEQYSYKWDSDCGIVIYPRIENSIPYVMVWRSYDTDSTSEYLHSSDLSGLYYEYGNDVLSASEPSLYSIAGISLSGAAYQYMVGDNKVTMLRLIDESPQTGYVLYTAKYLDDSKNDTLEALEVAISNFRAGRNSYDNGENNESSYEIIPSIKQTVIYETYSDNWFSMEIPKGWMIEADSFNSTASAFEIHIYDKNNPDRQLYTALQTLYFDSETSYTKLSNYILAGSAYKDFPYLLGASNAVAEMFKNFSAFQESAYGRNMYFSNMNNWTEIEKFGTSPLGGELIRAFYTNDSGTEIEGVFSGNWKKGMDIYGYSYPGVMYSPMFITAPADEFNDWIEILNHCLGSLSYTQNYMDIYYSEQESNMKTFRANTQIYNEMSDMITSSWYERQTTYDITFAKQSDAILGYDRVYNTETGDVYRVTIGFMDSYTGTLYSLIDDSMYSLPIAGYIY